MKRPAMAIMLGGPLHGRIVEAKGASYLHYLRHESGRLEEVKYVMDKLALPVSEQEVVVVMVMRYAGPGGLESWDDHEGLLASFAISHGEMAKLLAEPITVPAGVESGHGQ